MDNAQKAIMIGVGLFIAIVIISAVLLITNMGSTSIKKSTSEMGAISDSMQNQIIKDYDGKVISSTETLELIKKYYVGNDGVSIIFTNSTNAYPYSMLPNLARLGAKYINYYLNSDKIGTVRSACSKDPAIGDYIGYIVSFNSSYLKTPLSDFTNNTNLFYIAPGSKYKTSVLYRNTDYNSVLGITIQKAS